MKNIITIGRELGSGGRTVGKIVAESLGIAYYDRELIDEVAKQNGFSADFVEKTEENLNSSFLYNLAMSSSYFYDMLSLSATDAAPLTTQVFLAQQKAILQYAEKPCVIVGRCADYVLRERDDILSVFLYADPEKRLERAIERYNCDKKKASELIAKSDRARSRHYSAFTDWEWGSREHYDLMLNTSAVGFEGAAHIICTAFRADPAAQ